MVVEDDADIRRAVAESLSLEGYVVATAANGKQALGLVSQEAPDAIVLDLWMPVIDGRGFLARCRALPTCRNVPIIVMSAAHALRAAAELRDLGVRASSPSRSISTRSWGWSSATLRC
jgi:CheY-like chemotaxis protein